MDVSVIGKAESWRKGNKSAGRTRAPTFLMASIFCLSWFAGIGSTQAACSINFTSPARGSTVTTPTVSVSGTGSGNANPGD